MAGHVGVFQIKPLGFHILKTPLNRPACFVCLKNRARMADIGAHHHELVLDFLAYNNEVAIIDFLVKGAFFPLGQMDQEIAKILLAFPPLNKTVVFDADKKGM